jgi:hypothetical protein
MRKGDCCELLAEIGSQRVAYGLVFCRCPIVSQISVGRMRLCCSRFPNAGGRVPRLISAQKILQGQAQQTIELVSLAKELEVLVEGNNDLLHEEDFPAKNALRHELRVVNRQLAI